MSSDTYVLYMSSDRFGTESQRNCCPTKWYELSKLYKQLSRNTDKTFFLKKNLMYDLGEIDFKNTPI